MRSVTHFLRYSSLKCSKQTFTVRSAIVNSFTSSVFSLRGERENWEKLFLSCGRFHSLLVTFRNSKPRRHSEIKQTRPSTKQAFSGETLSKQNTEASLASLSWLVPGDDRVVRHICIRCIEIFLSHSCVQSQPSMKWKGKRSPQSWYWRRASQIAHSQGWLFAFFSALAFR